MVKVKKEKKEKVKKEKVKEVKKRAEIKDKPKMGRPEIYTDEIAQKICDEIVKGRGLHRICDDDDMPSKSTVFSWLFKDEKFLDRYRKAKEFSTECQELEILEIADDSSKDCFVDENGKRKIDHELVARSKLRIDTRKWVMARLAPNKYGAKIIADKDDVLTIVNALQP